MRTLLLLLMAGVAVLRADDHLLQNGDFSSGLAHWSGDVRSADSIDANGATLPPGAVIELRPRDWTRADQEFQVKSGTYKLHVTFTLLPKLHFSTDYSDYKNLKQSLNFTNPNHDFDASVGQWVVVVSDATARNSLCWTVDLTQPSGRQTFTCIIKDIDFANRQTLTLAFPPGNGLVVLQNVSLVPDGT